MCRLGKNKDWKTTLRWWGRQMQHRAALRQTCKGKMLIYAGPSLHPEGPASLVQCLIVCFGKFVLHISLCFSSVWSHPAPQKHFWLTRRCKGGLCSQTRRHIWASENSSAHRRPLLRRNMKPQSSAVPASMIRFLIFPMNCQSKRRSLFRGMLLCSNPLRRISFIVFFACATVAWHIAWTGGSPSNLALTYFSNGVPRAVTKCFFIRIWFYLHRMWSKTSWSHVIFRMGNQSKCKRTNVQNNGLRRRNALICAVLLQCRAKFWIHDRQAGADWIDWWVKDWIPIGSLVILSSLPGAIEGCR